MDYEDWKHEDGVYISKGTWVHLLKWALNDKHDSFQELLFRIIKKTGSMKTVYMGYEKDWKHEDGVYGNKGQDHI